MSKLNPDDLNLRQQLIYLVKNGIEKHGMTAESAAVLAYDTVAPKLVALGEISGRFYPASDWNY